MKPRYQIVLSLNVDDMKNEALLVNKGMSKISIYRKGLEVLIKEQNLEKQQEQQD